MPLSTRKYFLQKTIMSIIAANLQAVEATIQAACASSGRARNEVQLLAVSKTFPAQAVVRVQHRRLSPQREERPQQRYRVRSARDQHERPREIHPITLRR